MTATPQQPQQTSGGCGCGALVIGCLGIVALAVVGIVATVGVLYWQVTSEPQDWAAQRQALQQLSDEQREMLADETTNRFFTWASDAENNPANADPPAPAAPASDEPRTMEFEFLALNAWLDQYLRQTLDSEDVDLPQQISQVTVAGRDDQLTVAGRVQTERFNQVISLTVNPTLQDDGKLHLKLDRVRVGRIPLPTNTALQLADSIAGEQMEPEHREFLRQVLEGFAVDPVHQLDDQRRARLTELDINPERLRLTLITDPNQPADNE